VLAMCFIRKALDWLFTRHELKWLDDIMPESHKREKEEKKKKMNQEMIDAAVCSVLVMVQFLRTKVLVFAFILDSSVLVLEVKSLKISFQVLLFCSDFASTSLCVFRQEVMESRWLLASSYWFT